MGGFFSIAARTANPGMGGEEPENLIAYAQAGSEQYNATVGNIRKRLNLPTLRYQKLGNFIEAFGHPKE